MTQNFPDLQYVYFPYPILHTCANNFRLLLHHPLSVLSFGISPTPQSLGLCTPPSWPWRPALGRQRSPQVEPPFPCPVSFGCGDKKNIICYCQE